MRTTSYIEHFISPSSGIVEQILPKNVEENTHDKKGIVMGEVKINEKGYGPTNYKY
jgi:hypothetical protein